MKILQKLFLQRFKIKLLSGVLFDECNCVRCNNNGNYSSHLENPLGKPLSDVSFDECNCVRCNNNEKYSSHLVNPLGKPLSDVSFDYDYKPNTKRSYHGAKEYNNYTKCKTNDISNLNNGNSSFFFNTYECTPSTTKDIRTRRNSIFPNTHFEKIELFVEITYDYLEQQNKEYFNKVDICLILENIWKSIGNNKNELSIFLSHVLYNTSYLNKFANVKDEKYYSRGLLNITGQKNYYILTTLANNIDYLKNPEELESQNAEVIQDTAKFWRYLMQDKEMIFINSIKCFNFSSEDCRCYDCSNKNYEEMFEKMKIHNDLKKLFNQ
ncbi:hypothetical protein NAPIS_ORF00461 [Vairimorpha apis BRL 01]|uniref:Uncharacterized protein n=1 Tax=Vairimorpha apis BRL 01 TaxID=1037528 RepID=T0LCF2_9MICR|nr:hypothetical protein NAPIS_ORF00461 [Vairimorpha apis BRL 01]